MELHDPSKKQGLKTVNCPSYFAEASYFSISGVLAGTYTVTVTAQAFQKWQTTGIQFNAGDKRHLSSIELKLGALTQEVTVTAAADLVSTSVDSGEKSAVITAKQIQNISVVCHFWKA